MSLINWILKPISDMSNTKTKPVKIGRYLVTGHAQNRVADSKRNLKKSYVVRNLLGHSYETTCYDYKGEMQYDRIHMSTRTITHISPKHHVKTIYKLENPKKHIMKGIKNGKFKIKW